jgi:hypothetical protein
MNNGFLMSKPPSQGMLRISHLDIVVIKSCQGCGKNEAVSTPDFIAIIRPILSFLLPPE